MSFWTRLHWDVLILFQLAPFVLDFWHNTHYIDSSLNEKTLFPSGPFRFRGVSFSDVPQSTHFHPDSVVILGLSSNNESEGNDSWGVFSGDGREDSTGPTLVLMVWLVDMRVTCYSPFWNLPCQPLFLDQTSFSCHYCSQTGFLRSGYISKSWAGSKMSWNPFLSLLYGFIPDLIACQGPIDSFHDIPKEWTTFIVKIGANPEWQTQGSIQGMTHCSWWCCCYCHC